MNKATELLDLLRSYAPQISIVAFILWIGVLTITIIFTHPQSSSNDAPEIPKEDRPECIPMPDGLKVCDR